MFRKTQKSGELPVALATFPSTADDLSELQLDLNALLIKNKSSTFFFRVKGYSMQSEGIDNNDIAIADRSYQLTNGKLVIAVVDGNFLIKRYLVKNGVRYLGSGKGRFFRTKKINHTNIEIWGVVTHVVKQFI